MSPSSKFFGVLVHPGCPVEIKLDRCLTITNVSLAYALEDPSPEGRSTLSVEANGSEAVPVCALVPGRVPQQRLLLRYEESWTVTLTVEGPNPIAVSGCLGIWPLGDPTPVKEHAILPTKVEL